MEVKVAATWSDASAWDLDFNMFGPGDTVYYDAATAGVVNWEYLDKKDALPFALWTERSNGYGCETIEIRNLSMGSNYEFMLFDWSRVGNNDATADFKRVGAYIYLWGGSATGIKSTLFGAAPPTPPAGAVIAFWQPFILQSTGASTLPTVKVVNSFDPTVTQTAIDNGTPLYWSCSYSYCPYKIPGL